MPYYGDNSSSLDYLETAIHSVQAQTDPDWVLVIVDDASPAPFQSQQLPASITSDNRLHILRHTTRQGPGISRNTGVQHANTLGSPFVLFLDADDVTTASRLALTREAFLDDSVGVVYSSFSAIDGSGKTLSPEAMIPSLASLLRRVRTQPITGRDAWLEMATETGYTNLTSTTSVRMPYILQTPFPAEKISEDFHTWLRLGALGAEYACLDEETCQYRLWGGEAGSASRNESKGLFNRKKAEVDSDGFEQALDIAVSRGVLAVAQIPVHRAKFQRRLAEEIRFEGEDTLARILETLQPDQVTDPAIFLMQE